MSFTQEVINTCLNEFKKKDTIDKVDKYILDPIMNKVSERIFNYFLLFILIQIAIIMMLFYSIYSIKSK